jgi:DNA-directed RNA polymerase subunit RPC12/RpoP
MGARVVTSIERHRCKCGQLVITATRARLVTLLGPSGGLECPVCGSVLIVKARAPAWLRRQPC